MHSHENRYLHSPRLGMAMRMEVGHVHSMGMGMCISMGMGVGTGWLLADIHNTRTAGKY